MNYFPSPDNLLYHTLSAQVNDPDQKTFGIRVLNQLISHIILQIGIDETRYLADYPDLKAAVDDGQIGSGAEHFATTGFFERRRALPANFDPEWYTRKYPDVAQYMAHGEDTTPADHFLDLGFNEWRLPCASAQSDLRFWLTALT